MKLSKLITILALTAQALAGGVAHASESGGHGGNGGGLIQQNGVWKTFYSAGFYTEPMESTSDEVPQLAQLMNFFNTTQMLSEMTKVKYASSLMPSPSRQYFKVKENSFTPEVRNNLIDVYRRQMQIDPAQQVGLAAITDTESKTTYLLPNFYKLTPIEQQAILFHETYWLVNPTATYAQVVNAEMTFQAYLTAPNSPERLLRLAQTVGTGGDVWTAAVRTDLANKSLKGLVTNGHFISMTRLLGPQTINCVMRGMGTQCTPFVSTNAFALSQQFKGSLFLKLFYMSVTDGKFQIQASDKCWGGVDPFQYFTSSGGDCGSTKTWESIAAASFDMSAIGYTNAPVFDSKVSGYKGLNNIRIIFAKPEQR